MRARVAVTAVLRALCSVAFAGTLRTVHAFGAGQQAGRQAFASPLVQTEAGAVQGQVVGRTLQFTGIPYAQPPLGDLRWCAPQPLQPWKSTLRLGGAVRTCAQLTRGKNNKARLAGRPAMQQHALLPGSSEDCLYLSVTRPVFVISLLPVMVWIHGGGFRTGSGADLGSRIGFPPRKRMSSYFLLKWGVQIPYIFHENQTPRSDLANLVHSKPNFCPQILEPRCRQERHSACERAQ